MYNQKEMNLLTNLKEEESLCCEKYRQYAEKASNQQLALLMNKIGNEEQEHLKTINKLIAGEVPAINPCAPKSPAAEAVSEITAYDETYKNNVDGFNSDKYLCADALGTEKHVSSSYDTSIFEFKHRDVRDVLNHIQKEEQQHGEKIYNYMAANGMYQG